MKPERDAPRTPELDALLGAARRRGEFDPAGEERALRAFRPARDEGGVRAAPVRWRRSRDDWRPGGQRHWAQALKALAAGVAAAAALGGVAVAAGEGAIPSPFGGVVQPEPVRTAPTEPGVEEGGAGGARGEGAPQGPVRPTQSSADDAPPGRPGTARDTAAHCRQYLAAVSRPGKTPRGKPMAELEAAAGGPDAVRAYCERLSADEMNDTLPNPADGKPAKSAEKPADKPQKPADKPQKPAGKPQKPGKPGK
ncbi:hypothetical protein AB0D12_09385 [Streptomyces sp. NPDC048479]|uniref:hypothetical protein n=1 Tax=Streptomyces sp. NPDC048479 TaxID=3154725 RepID=UPI00343158D9